MGNKFYELYILLLNFVCDTIATFFLPVGPTTSDKEEILMVKLSAVGDFVLWLDAAAELRRLYTPERYRLVLFGNSIWTDLAQQLPYFDEVIPIERKLLYYNVQYRFKMWHFIRKRSWATSISSDYSREFLYGDTVIRISAATERIGFIGDLSNQPAWRKCISNLWYTKLISSDNRPLMELERNAEFIRGLGVHDFQARLPRLNIPDALPKNFVQNYFVVVPGAGVSYRQWPPESFAEIIAQITSEYGLTPVICGAPDEKRLGARLRNQLCCPAEDWCGKTTLTELVSIIKGARFVLGNESGAMHIAAAVGTPVFCITGGGHWGRFVPYNVKNPATGPLPVPIVHKLDCFCCNWKCKFQIADGRPVRCIELVSIDDVLKAIHTSMSNDKIAGK